MPFVKLLNSHRVNFTILTPASKFGLLAQTTFDDTAKKTQEEFAFQLGEIREEERRIRRMLSILCTLTPCSFHSRKLFLPFAICTLLLLSSYYHSRLFLNKSSKSNFCHSFQTLLLFLRFFLPLPRWTHLKLLKHLPVFTLHPTRQLPPHSQLPILTLFLDLLLLLLHLLNLQQHLIHATLSFQ